MNDNAVLADNIAWQPDRELHHQRQRLENQERQGSRPARGGNSYSGGTVVQNGVLDSATLRPSALAAGREGGRSTWRAAASWSPASAAVVGVVANTLLTSATLSVNQLIATIFRRLDQ